MAEDDKPTERQPFGKENEFNSGGGMGLPDIAKAFRASELQRREVRRKIMLNHAALENEPLSDFDKEADKAARESIARQQVIYELNQAALQEQYRQERAKQIQRATPVRTYFRRLWRAVLGRDL